jgi:signal peptidase II
MPIPISATAVRMPWGREGMSPARFGACLAALTLVADQASKNFLLYGLNFKDLGPAARIEIAPFLDLVLVWNRGISYGLFQADSIWATAALTIFSLAAVAALAFWLSRAGRRILALGLGLVIGGAIGNVVDRILYGAVVDFFHFYAFGRDWYVFNVADAAITVGVVFLLLDAYKHREEPDTNREPVIRK